VRFCRHYVEHGNATRAYAEAGFPPRPAPSVWVAACWLFRGGSNRGGGTDHVTQAAGPGRGGNLPAAWRPVGGRGQPRVRRERQAGRPSTGRRRKRSPRSSGSSKPSSTPAGWSIPSNEPPASTWRGGSSGGHVQTVVREW